eukprot:scaffold101737_cov29-Tisochrysis_lutea.AAC.1
MPLWPSWTLRWVLPPEGAVVAHASLVPRRALAGKPALPGHDLPLDGLKELHDRIMAEVSGISRIALDITSKPPATTEWE